MMMNTAEEAYGEEDRDDATLFLIDKKGGCWQRVSVRGVGWGGCDGDEGECERKYTRYRMRTCVALCI